MDTNQSIKDTSLQVKDIGNSSLYLQKISLKTERLTSALYLVTDLIDYDEPLKNKLRSSAVEVMSAISMSNNTNHFLDDRALAVVRKNISVVISCLEVSFNVGLCSSMNCAILKREYDSLKELLDSDLVTRGAGVISIPSNFLYPSLEEIKSAIGGPASGWSKAGAPGDNSYGHDKGQVKDNQELKTNQVQGSTSTRLNLEPGRPLGREVYKGDRRGLVVSLFKDDSEYTVKDILSRLSFTGKKVEISEKTIQRDLLSLVAEGVLNKRGERRWSRYSKK